MYTLLDLVISNELRNELKSIGDEGCVLHLVADFMLFVHQMFQKIGVFRNRSGSAC